MRTVKYEEKYPELERFLKYFKENKKYIRNFNIASTVEFQHETKTHVQSFYRESFDDEKYISVACTEKVIMFQSMKDGVTANSDTISELKIL